MEGDHQAEEAVAEVVGVGNYISLYRNGINVHVRDNYDLIY